MRNLFYTWRFYSYGREQYQECMNKIFMSNLNNLRKASQILAVFAGLFTIFPLVFERDLVKAGVYILVAFVGLLVFYSANYLMQQINVKTRLIYFLIVLYYSNIMIFGTYLDLWSNPDSIAAIFPCFLICSLLMFVIPPRFTLFLTLGAMALFIASAFFMLKYHNVIYYIANTLIAGGISLYFCWQITKLRMGLEISTTMLDEERIKYIDQSITDELTQLKNRRDFNQTFQRFLSNYRASDDWLCIALADIDFFKLYNDHYGHPKGDDCLRGIGGALNSLSALGVYAARVGGEEFALLWFEKDATHVNKVITHWTNAIRDLKILHEKSKVSEYVTMSIGVYVVKCGTHQDTQELYDHADKALYTAKSGGRNCAIVLGDEIKEYKITSSDES